MKEKLQERIQMLKTEFEAGQTMLAELEAKEANLRQTLLRIGGAIQVLEEILSETPEDNVELSSGSNSGSGTIAPPQPSENLVL
jgi:predicted nuclease with TOPRIM domain